MISPKYQIFKMASDVSSIVNPPSWDCHDDVLFWIGTGTTTTAPHLNIPNFQTLPGEEYPT